MFPSNVPLNVDDKGYEFSNSVINGSTFPSPLISPKVVFKESTYDIFFDKFIELSKYTVFLSKIYHDLTKVEKAIKSSALLIWHSFAFV